MNDSTMKHGGRAFRTTRSIRILVWALLTLALAAMMAAAQAAVPGITGSSFDLVAKGGRSSQPDGNSIYSWGFGCNSSAPAHENFLKITRLC